MRDRLSTFKTFFERASCSKTTLYCVFDLDSTVFCVSPRTEFILHNLAGCEAFQQRFPQQAQILRQISVFPTDWGIKSALQRSQIVGPIDFFEAVREHWAQNFFSNKFLDLDQPYPEIIPFIQKLSQLPRVEIRYLTARDRRRMGEGTLASLKKWNLPLEQENHLAMKPEPGFPDAYFKRDYLQQVYPPDQQVWFFDNEPVILNLVKRDLPHIELVFVDSVHSGREQPHPDIPKIRVIDK